MKNVNFHSCIKIDHKIWFVSVEGYLMNFDTNTFQPEIIAPNNLSELHFKSVVDNMISVGNKIYFVEQDGSRLYEYNQFTNNCNYYLIPDTRNINWGCFSGIYLFDQMIYLFARVVDRIYCFDIIRKKFTSITTEKKDIVLNSFRIQNKVYLYGEKALCFDMDSHSFNSEIYMEAENVFWMNSYQNTIFFLTENHMGIWNEKRKSKEILYEGEELSKKFLVLLTTKNKIFLLPNQSEDILILDQKTGKTSFAVSPKDLYYIEKGWSKYWGYTEDEKSIWCANRVSNYVLSIDKETEEIRWIKLKRPDLKAEIPYLELLDKRFFSESEIALKQFLLISNNGSQYSRSSYGREMWRKLRE